MKLNLSTIFHNDGGPMDTGQARGSLKGTGEETREVILEASGKTEVVHTYGWYMRKTTAGWFTFLLPISIPGKPEPFQ